MSTRTALDRSSRVTVVLLFGTIAVISAGCSGPSDDVPSDAPPIVLIDLGTLRADHLGSYGYPRATSPNIDALAAESTRFEWAFSQAPNTAPSLASTLTGLYPATHGMRSGENRLPEAAVTLAEGLAERGYATAAFVDGGYLSAGFGFDQGFAHYESSGGGGLAEIGPRAIEWLRAHASEPFFLMVHSYDVHAPYDSPQELRDTFVADLDSPVEGFEATTERLDEAQSGDRPFTPSELEHARALYDAGILFVDGWVGQLTSASTSGRSSWSSPITARRSSSTARCCTTRPTRR